MDDPKPTAADARSRSYPERPLVGVGVVVWRGDQVLLVKRGKAPRKGEWGLPGGGQELGETIREAAVRETLEETGLTVRADQVITVVDSVSRDDKDRIEFHYTLVEIAAEYVEGEPEARDDVDAVRWAGLDDINHLVSWEETRRVIREAARQRRAVRRERIESDRAKLKPRPGFGRVRLMRSPIGRMIARPWLDDVTIQLLSGWVFPMSRAWGAATIAGGEFGAFRDALSVDPESMSPSRWLSSSLKEIDRAVRRMQDCDADWQDALFGPGGVSSASAVAAEEARLDAANALAMSKLRLVYFGRGHKLAACNWAIPTPEQVEERHGAGLNDPDQAYGMPETLPRIRESRMIGSDIGVEYWLCLDSPSEHVDTPCWARVFEPAGVPDPPTVIHLHGICMEQDHIRAPLRDLEIYCERGIRVIAPEAPSHGRRRQPGRYGGEAFVAGTPLSTLDHMAAHVREIGILTDWSRRTSAGPVGWSGISLGALTSQLAASHAAAWPRSMRADALALFTTSEGIEEIGLTGEIAKAFGVDRELTVAGWTDEMLRRWRPLTDPVQPPSMGPENVFMVLGTEDRITPFEHGMGIARRWGVPDGQVFVRPQGHFSVPAGLMVDEAPVAAFANHLKHL